MNTLFDFSFRTFLTTRLVRIVYGLELLAIALLMLVRMGAALDGSFMEGVGAVIGNIIGALLAAMVARMLNELVIVVFRGVELLSKIEQHQRAAQGGPRVAV